MRNKIRWMLHLKRLPMIVACILYSCYTHAQTQKPMPAKDTLNIGFVHYTKSNTPGTLYARWNYANIWSGPGIATGGPKDGFEGKYHVRYFYENGDFSDEYDLEIEKTGDFYRVSWIVKEKVLAIGVGMDTGSGLAVGWRRVKD